MTATIIKQPASKEVIPTYAEVKAPSIAAGDYFYTSLTPASKPAADPEEVELEEYASPT